MCVSRVLECIEPLYLVLVCSIESLIFTSLLKLIFFFTRHDVIEVINKTEFQYSDNQKVYTIQAARVLVFVNILCFRQRSLLITNGPPDCIRVDF